MPRKAFVSDLSDAIAQPTIHTISDLCVGAEDGTFTFVCKPATAETGVNVQALIPDVSEYPSSHQFFLYTASGNPPPAVSKTLENLTASTSGMKVSQLLPTVATSLGNALANKKSPSVDMDIDEADDILGEEDLDDTQSVGGWSPGSPEQGLDIRNDGRPSVRSSSMTDSLKSGLKSRIRADLCASKAAGFKVGQIGGWINPTENLFLSVSCLISKLGISAEAMEAWGLDPHQYLIFLINYTSGYKPAERLIAHENWHARHSVEMRVGVGNRYKPTLTEVIAAFSKVSSTHGRATQWTGDERATDSTTGAPPQTGSYRAIFIGRPLNELLNERLIILLGSRLRMGVGWGGAEDFYNESQGKNRTNSDHMESKYYKDDCPRTTLPPLVTADHLKEKSNSDALSFPLIGMQFVLRHLVRCTEFCLVCHCRVDATFEALKPYVCPKPLCLYQYMALGFGPSIEYEITSQPNVVDLLISFCYYSAKAERLRDFPTGMSLIVPPAKPDWHPGRKPNENSPGTLNGVGIQSDSVGAKTRAEIDVAMGGVDSFGGPKRDSHRVKFNQALLEIIFEGIIQTRSSCPIKVGDWIVLTLPTSPNEQAHYRVMETDFYPTVKLSEPARRATRKVQPTQETFTTHGAYPVLSGAGKAMMAQKEKSQASAPIADPSPVSKATLAEFVIYNQNFDNMTENEQRQTVMLLLETLPSVEEMQQYLAGTGSGQASLLNWKTRISPAALGVLRWIIASNRSCILEVGKNETDRLDQRVQGMDGWVQFRFAQGAPDKEQRFINSLQSATTRLNLSYPSIFAWHGSPLYNWHGIVREGLHFKETQHGRAFGHGCYHSLDLATSMGYSGSYLYNASIAGGEDGGWPQSRLRVTTALSLNEIVNAPSEYVSKTPHLVVAQLDWIQTRYLFIRSARLSPGFSTPPEIHQKPILAYPQDVMFTPVNEKRTPIIVPLASFGSGRRAMVKTLLPETKLKKWARKKIKVMDNVLGAVGINVSEDDEASLAEDDLVSIDTTRSDRDMLLSDDEAAPVNDSKDDIRYAQPDIRPILTDFVPGKLNHKSLPMLEAPSYATSSATRTLQRELGTILKIQESNPLHELGWHIDAESVANVYQWIVELHSFDKKLPLASDLKKKGITSVVLEIRFGKEYPMSPPFVRVIRPRFRPFSQQGGGHVTAGGALCMELLTNSGWSAVSSIESVLLQVRMAMSSIEPFPARLEPGASRDYHVGEAVDAYVRACRMHGWEVPKDFHAFSAQRSLGDGAGK